VLEVEGVPQVSFTGPEAAGSVDIGAGGVPVVAEPSVPVVAEPSVLVVADPSVSIFFPGIAVVEVVDQLLPYRVGDVAPRRACCGVATGLLDRTVATVFMSHTLDGVELRDCTDCVQMPRKGD